MRGSDSARQTTTFLRATSSAKGTVQSGGFCEIPRVPEGKKTDFLPWGSIDTPLPFCYKAPVVSSELAITIKKVVFFALPIVFSISFHEAAHAFMAERRGDRTATFLGRKTLNPIAHIDLFGTVILPAILIWLGGIVFGWAKPVPVNPLNLKDVKRDTMWISLAGPGSNLILAGAFGLLAHLLIWLLPMLPLAVAEPLLLLCGIAVYFNLVLAFFNLIPLPPLDGSKILVGLFPNRQFRFFQSLESNPLLSFLLFFLLIWSGATRFLAIPVYLGYTWFTPAGLSLFDVLHLSLPLAKVTL